jgi:surface antigen
MLTVHGHPHQGPLSLARQIRVLQYAGASSRPQADQLKRAAQAWWASNSASILSGFRTGQSAGQCTAYVAARRPDIIERVDMWAYARYLIAGSGGLDVNWDAEYWAANARRAGLRTGTVPRPGAVIVFQAGAYGATSLGHVAYVDAVGRDGSFTISEMHAPVVGRLTSRHFDAGTARAMSAGPGVAFIYR